MTISVPPPEEGDGYSDDVNSVLERGSSFNGPLSSWAEWKKDAYLLYSKPTVSLEELVNMRRTDGQARALGNLVALPIVLSLQTGRWVAPPTGGGEEETEFANLMWTLPPALGGMTTVVNDLVSQMALAIYDGFAAFELVSHVPDIGPLKGKKTLRKMSYRDPRTVTLLQDERGGYAGFRQQVFRPGHGMLDVSLPPAKTALFTVNAAENPLYGVSFFESAFPHFEKKLKWYYVSEMAGQFSAVPGRIGTVPRGAKANDVVAFRQALEGLYFNTTLLKKQGFEVDAFNAVSGFNFSWFIEHHNMMMAKSVLASFFESEQRTVLVENSTEDASADIFLLSMETLANQFASVLTNHMMPKYIRANFKNSEKFPVFKPGPLSDNARKQIFGLFERLVVSSVLNSTPELVRNLEKVVANDLALDVDYEDIEAREEEAAIQQAEQAEILAAQAQQETLEAERAQEGAIPNAPLPQSGATTTPAEDVVLSDIEALEQASLDALYSAAKKLFEVSPYEDHPVDEGLV